MYIPIAQHDDVARFLHALTIRTRGIEPDALASAIRGAVSAVNPNVSLTFRTLADQVDASYSREHAVATLSAFFGVLAVLLAALGLYGITAYAVSRRHVEIGIRMALGADTRDVLRLVLGRVLTLVILGGAIGGATSLWASRFIAPLLYGLRPGDPTTFAYASAVLLTVACVASALPAGRAVRINPAEVFNNM
jgi:ABC-type antimicrobial peptide transport system permease subunit